ncbi:hypothetical protein BH11PSE2_BH11PSE2_18710 [soil metagenome]
MRYTARTMAAGLALAAVAAVGGAADARGSGACDRNCLSGVLDAYLTAVVRHDVSAAPLAAGYRGTENAVEVAPGQGVWKSATGLGAVQRRYVDPVNGTAAFFGLFGEQAGPAITSLRIKVEGRMVKEAEFILGRPGEALYSPAGLTAAPPRAGLLKKAERATRAQLEAAANSYFDGLEAHSGAKVLHNPGCQRLENGARVTGMVLPWTAAFAPPPELRAEYLRGDCAKLDGQTQIRAVVHRRFPVIDEEAGVVLGTAMFLRPPGSTRQRLLLSEYFETGQGRINTIYAAMNYLSAAAPETTGW